MLLPVTHLTLRVIQNCRIAAVNKCWNERFVNSATRRILHNTSCSCCSLLFQFSTSTTITATVCDCSHLSLYPGNRRYVCEEPSTTTILEKNRCNYTNHFLYQSCMTTLLEMLSYYVQYSFRSFIPSFLLKCSDLFKHLKQCGRN